MRISTQAASQSALMDLMRAQREAFEANQQFSSGKRAPDLKGYGNDVERITTARSTLSRTQTMIDANERFQNRLEAQDLAYENLTDAANDLREALTTVDGTLLMNSVREAFDTSVSALNTRFNGSFVFGGVRTDVAPVSANTLADLQAAVPDVSAVFNDAPRRQTAMLDDETPIDLNSTASEVGLDLMAAFERIADFDAGPSGPLDGQLNDTQQAFLRTEIENVIAAFDTINLAMAENGARLSRVESAIVSHESRKDYLEIMVAGLEEVDMAEAATRLDLARVALEISASTFSTLSQTSLLPFLR